MPNPRLYFLPPFLILILFSGAATSGTITGKVNCADYCTNIIIYIKDVPGEFSGEEEVAVLDQVEKTYIPHVLPILKGTTVQLQNNDPFLHNIHAYFAKKTFFNIALPLQGQTVNKRFRRAGTYVMLCDVHEEMSAYIVALDNPFFTKPDETGLYEISDVPSGTYVLVKYDPEEKETVEKTITVNEDIIVNF